MLPRGGWVIIMIAMPFHYTIVDTRLGRIGLVCSPAGLRRVVIGAPQDEASRLVTDVYRAVVESAAAFGDLPERLRRYLDGERVKFGDSIDWSGMSPFGRAVMEANGTIPYGETRSYSWVARQVGRPRAARAVGQVLARNPLPLVVPCHRVLGSNGSLTGFTGGLEMKRWLLELEETFKYR